MSISNCYKNSTSKNTVIQKCRYVPVEASVAVVNEERCFSTRHKGLVNRVR